MNFNAFVTRIDIEIIQQIVGRSAIQILNILDSDLTRMSELQAALLNIYSPSELFHNKEIRNSLLDLLKTDEAEELIVYLGKKPTTDNYGALKAINFKQKENITKLLSFFEIEIEEDIADSKVQTLTTTPTNYPLFKHQRNAIKELNGFLYSGRKRALLHMPTGSGKTRTAMNVICNHFRGKEPTVIIWLAHTEELCEQAAQEFETAWRNLGDREIDIVRYWGGGNKRHCFNQRWIYCWWTE